VSEVDQRVAILQAAGLGYGEQACRSDFSLCAAVAEACFPPLHRDAQRSFGGVIGRLHARLRDERKQPVAMHVQSRSQVAYQSVLAVQMSFGQ